MSNHDSIEILGLLVRDTEDGLTVFLEHALSIQSIVVEKMMAPKVDAATDGKVVGQMSFDWPAE